tara:strand:- start:836 stop:1657 length:822 start_codon:yes stop_codon:yes gene_type:complete
MKYLRRYIRQILFEDAFDFAKETGMLQRDGEMSSSIRTPMSGPMANKASRRKLKDIFRKHADHQWLANNITTVHWMKDHSVLESLIGKGKDELSTAMYKTGYPVEWHSYGSLGLWIKGHISLAVNDMDDLVSGHYRDYTDKSQGWSADAVDSETFQHQIASSGINKQPKKIHNFRKFAGIKDDEKSRKIFNDKYKRDFPYVLDADTWEQPGRQPNEALVDNWQPEGIILANPSHVEWLEDTSTPYHESITALANKFGVPIFDENFKALWYPGE